MNNQGIKKKIKQLTAEVLPEIINIRRHLHKHPELSFEEYQTSAYICSILDKWGISYQKGIVNTGIVGVIKGKKPDTKIVALRADIDALPIQEQTGLEFQSINNGVMHACGHDVHSASLLGTLYILNQTKEEWEGSIKFIFQPGEEQLPGGAKLMIEEGVLKNPKVEKIFGQHVYPELEAGKVGFKSGTYMASADELHVTVTGKGGHAALPHQLIDPILISSHIIVALQQIVSRNASPYLPTVLSFGDIHGSGATNVIPNTVTIKGTFRTFDEKWRKEAHQKMKKMAESMAESMGGKCDFEIRKGYPVLVNDLEVTDLAKQNAIDYLGKENVIDLEQRMTAEDFAYYSQVVPSCFYRLGTANEKEGLGGNLHHPRLTIDEKSLETSIGLMAFLAILS